MGSRPLCDPPAGRHRRKWGDCGLIKCNFSPSGSASTHMCVEPGSPAGFELISVSARFLLLRLSDRHVEHLFKALNRLQPNQKEIWAHCASQAISSLLQGEVEGSDGPSTHPPPLSSSSLPAPGKGSFCPLAYQNHTVRFSSSVQDNERWMEALLTRADHKASQLGSAKWWFFFFFCGFGGNCTATVSTASLQTSSVLHSFAQVLIPSSDFCEVEPKIK